MLILVLCLHDIHDNVDIDKLSMILQSSEDATWHSNEKKNAKLTMLQTERQDPVFC